MFSTSGRDSADGPVRARAWGTAGSSGVMPGAGSGRAASVGWLGSSMSITVLLRMMVSGMFTGTRPFRRAARLCNGDEAAVGEVLVGDRGLGQRPSHAAEALRPAVRGTSDRVHGGPAVEVRHVPGRIGGPGAGGDGALHYLERQPLIDG